jgi:hypothetical protein
MGALLIDADATTLADRIMDDALMVAHDTAIDMDDLAGLGSAGPQPFDHAYIIAVGHKADVLAIGLGRDLKAEAFGERAGFRFRQMAKREAQIIELLLRRREQEIALVALRVGAAMQLGAALPHDPLHIMAGREAIAAEVTRLGEQIAELDPLVAAHAGDRRLALQIGIRKFLHHRIRELGFVIQHEMRNADALGDAAGVIDILTRAAGALLGQRHTVIVKLQRHADHVIALLLQERSHDRAVDAARHCDDDPRVGRGLGKT